MASRTRNHSANEGSFLFGGYEMGGLNFPSGYETVQSADGVGGGEYFRVIRKRPIQFIRLNGQVKGIGSPTYKNYIPGGCRSGYSAQHIAISGRPSNGELAAKLAARSNPSAADISLPTVIGELRDLARTFATTNASAIHDYIGSNYLRLEFGLKPLIRDIQSLVKAQELIDRRFQRLRRMREQPDKAESRTMDLWTGSASETIKDVLIHNGEPVVGDVARTTSHRTWGWVRWTPSNLSALPASDQALRALALRTTLGLNTANVLSTAWNLIPYSWLADYFGSVGDYLVANQNVVGATISACCIMDHIETTESVSFTYVYPGLKATGGRYLYETKQRMPTFPSISASLPIFNEKQTTILGALAASRSGYR